MKRSAWILAVLIAMLWPAGNSNAQTTKGAVIFEQHCASCHGNPSSATPAPDVLSLWKMTLGSDLRRPRQGSAHVPHGRAGR